MIVAFTGHRPNKLGGYVEAGDSTQEQDYAWGEMSDALAKLQPVSCISGMAQGTDQMAAELCIHLKIPFIAAVPFEGQEKKWPDEAQKYYKWLLERANQVHVVCTGGYAPYKLQLRNEWMVDNCDHLIAVFDGSKGGTANCIAYAKSKGKPMTIINPKNCPR